MSAIAPSAGIRATRGLLAPLLSERLGAQMYRRLRPLIAAAALASAAQAGDGEIEINQANALAGSVSSCDAPGFPVEICESGSYRLTSDLVQSVADRAVWIQASEVTLDLNGMKVRGPNLCQGVPTVGSCMFVLGAALIDGSGAARVTVAHGRVIGGAGHGIHLGADSTVRDVQASENGTAGIVVVDRSTVSDSSALSNRRDGILCSNTSSSSGCVMRDVLVSGNGWNGLRCQQCSVKGVAAARNGDMGIDLGRGSQLSDFSSTFNGWSGVRASDGAMVSFGAIRDNGWISGGGAYGLEGQGGAAYHGVVITSSVGGNSATASNMVNLGNNSCQGGACPP